MSRAELGRFVLRTQVLILYRGCLKAIRRAPEEAKGKLEAPFAHIVCHAVCADALQRCSVCRRP
jgi:hypothetical protein